MYSGAPQASSYTLVAPNPTGGVIGVASADWMLAIPNGTTLANPVHVTFAISGGGTGIMATLAGLNATAVGTVTPTGSPSNRLVSTSNDGGLTDPPAQEYVAIAASGGSNAPRIIGG